MFRLFVGGGFVPVGYDQTAVPVISVYGDGRVIMQGVQIAIYPGPLLPSLQVQYLTEAGMRALLDAAAKAGLLVKDVTYGANDVADAPTSFFTLVADGCVHHVNAYALIEGLGTTGLDKETIEARARLLAFRDALMDLSTLVGTDNITDGGLFQATSYRIVVREDTSGPGASASPLPTVAWPLKTPLATFGAPLWAGVPDVRCGIVTGADAAKLQPLLEKANAETRWSSGNKTYFLMVRPSLPDETGCEPLA